jgi:hypothetical protein
MVEGTSSFLEISIGFCQDVAFFKKKCAKVPPTEHIHLLFPVGQGEL